MIAVTIIYWYGCWRLFGWYLFHPRCLRVCAGVWWAGVCDDPGHAPGPKAE